MSTSARSVPSWSDCAAAIPAAWPSTAQHDMLRVAVEFAGTNTHGLKAFRREGLRSVVERTVKSVAGRELSIEFVVPSPATQHPVTGKA